MSAPHAKQKWPNTDKPIVRVHVALGGEEVDKTEEEIIRNFKSHLISKSIEERTPLTTDFHIGLHVIAAEKSLGVVLYYQCKSLSDLVELREMQITGDLKTVIERMFSRLLLSPLTFSEVTAENLKYVVESIFTQLFYRSQIASLTVTLFEDEYEKCKSLLPGHNALRAVYKFDHRQMRTREKKELRRIVKIKRQTRKRILDIDEQIVKNQSRINSDVEDDANLNSMVLSFEKGNQLETVSPANIGDNVGWWMVRHFDSGLIGYVPRNRVVINFTSDEQPSKTNLYNLPLEMLDIILQKCHLHWTANLSAKNKNEEVVRTLMSVDVCFYRRFSKPRFKNAIWRHLQDFYEITKKRATIIRNNRNYLIENIQPSEELISSLLSLNCITKEQSHFIQHQSLNRDKNVELLYLVRSFDETKFAIFVNCLRKYKQKTVARIIENGGGVMKSRVHIHGAKHARLRETRLLHLKMEDFLNRAQPWSHETDISISQQREKGIEIVSSHMDRETVVVWIWCHSPAAQKYMQRLYESNQLRDVFFEAFQQSTTKLIKIDGIQFKKTFVARPITIDFSEEIDFQRDAPGSKLLFGLTKLRSEIYALCSSKSSGYTILVYEDRNAFCLQKKIEINETNSPSGIGANKKENCIYVSDEAENCVLKLTKESDDEFRILKWLTTDYRPSTLSVSSDSELLMLSKSSSILMIYGSDSELIRLIELPAEMGNTYDAVKTSIGNFIVIHFFEKSTQGVVSELTSDGQMVVRRFIHSSEEQILRVTCCLSIDSDDQVFVADRGLGRVILLDSDLKWNRILVPAEYEKEETRLNIALYYDDEDKQLIVKSLLKQLDGINVYNLIRK